jgi:hypothetical protein
LGSYGGTNYQHHTPHYHFQFYLLSFFYDHSNGLHNVNFYNLDLHFFDDSD